MKARKRGKVPQSTILQELTKISDAEDEKYLAEWEKELHKAWGIVERDGELYTVEAIVADVYDRLSAAYGAQGWWPGDSAFEVCVGAILTQSAAWTNVEKAIANLKAAGALSPRALHRMSEPEIAGLIRPSGYFNAKARKLKAFAELVFRGFDGHLHCLLREPAETLRPLLLETHGIGPETADCIVLYAAGYPSFVIDAYTRRVFTRILGPGHGPQRDTYGGWQALFHEAIRPDAGVYGEYHALIVRLAKEVCRKSAPRCAECVLREVCTYGRTQQPP